MAELTYLQAISDGLRTEMRRDKRVFVIGEDVGVYGGAFKVTLGFQEEFGAWRVIDTPLSETAIVAGATGAAISSPLASSGVAGQTHLSPGMCAKDDSGFCEWNGPPEKPPPEGSRTTIGTGVPAR